ncbi:hypothetical protein CYMTET_14820 [Cymbomonas tetramitiformis]|uniref:Uncharacterized protein n=1 Tax=Cymbomonas tetramitiformis TaxID=36881 RepID=A0AAE0L9T0_9CHLO|nr:hypothetical protein CYMTET_14820 [Cymbomonas tetramitiformis]
MLQKQNEVFVRDNAVEICDIDDLESILDGPLNNAGYDWSLVEQVDTETLAKVFIFATADSEPDPEVDNPTADDIKLGTTDSPRSGTPSEYSADDPDNKLGFTRGVPGHGKYRIFAAVIDAGYCDRMPQNAIKLVGDECELADEWLGRPAKQTGNWAAL